MLYNRLNEEGQRVALALAAEQGLEGKVTTEITPWGEKSAYFKLKVVARGNAKVAEAAAKMHMAGIEPDVLFMGSPPEVWGGFYGEAFSRLGSAYKAKEVGKTSETLQGAAQGQT